MKRFIFFVLFAFFSAGIFAQKRGQIKSGNTSSAAEISANKSTENAYTPKFKKGRKGECFLIPAAGWGAPGFLTALDFAYCHYNGFTLYFNNNLFLPMARYGGFAIMSEMYFGYSWKLPNLYFTLTAGFSGGGGIYVADGSYINRRGRKIRRYNYGTLILIFGGIRNDVTYFFNDTLGLTVSQTHGFGRHAGRWILEDKVAVYSFFLKLGLTVKV